MKNRGQTTVLFSCMISVLLIFTLTALEVGRIKCGKIKICAVIHSAQSAIMADYNRELFERYHLLFIDPTYGSGSDAVLEERLKNYIDASLNGNDDKFLLNSAFYDFSVEEIAVADKKTITDDHMRLLKKQIADYERSEGMVRKATELSKKYVDSSGDIKEAGEKTKRNATPIPESDNSDENDNKENNNKINDEDNKKTTDEKGEKKEVDDPRKKLKDMLGMGLLALVLPEGTTVSGQKHDLKKSVSAGYKEIIEDEKDNSFSDVSKLVGLLNDFSKDNAKTSLGVTTKLAFCSYVLDHFSYQGNDRDGVMKCETEYILKGRDNDHDNLEAVISDIIWLRMPVNYICLLSDAKRQSETLTLATAICSATGTMPMVEVVKYLLLGCWSYGESVYEVRQLMHGNKLPFVKTPVDWNTDLKTLAKTGAEKKNDIGMDYQDYLCLFLVKKESKDMTYARMLDVIEMNLKRNDENLSVVNLCGEITVQGKITFNPLLSDRGDKEIYSYPFEEVIAY